MLGDRNILDLGLFFTFWRYLHVPGSLGNGAQFWTQFLSCLRCLCVHRLKVFGHLCPHHMRRGAAFPLYPVRVFRSRVQGCAQPRHCVTVMALPPASQLPSSDSLLPEGPTAVPPDPALRWHRSPQGVVSSAGYLWAVWLQCPSHCGCDFHVFIWLIFGDSVSCIPQGPLELTAPFLPQPQRAGIISTRLGSVSSC